MVHDIPPCRAATRKLAFGSTLRAWALAFVVGHITPYIGTNISPVSEGSGIASLLRNLDAMASLIALEPQ